MMRMAHMPMVASMKVNPSSLTRTGTIHENHVSALKKRRRAAMTTKAIRLAKPTWARSVKVE